ncbi:GntR family transcriptional regulator [Halalkalibacterium halodurans]|jgi:DNA-binding transcriptional regulator YhcF (GntR family)|uniref:GntR family transcriptional regulator n=1 Tax=Halalkalibacterium halodurans TaxID=86665 RepID=UPI001067C002|nr:GntR family transcriptional regulator [Halalkalibacterium halodurans]TES56020.1 GntR family transcriptional regulator [Halalkalibacterium halodurans]
MKMNFNKRDPVYLQVIRHFKERIATGALLPGEEIPSRRELANSLKINPNTAQRAYKEMEEQGLIKTEGNLPSKITNDPDILASVRSELIRDAVDNFIAAIKPIHVPIDEVITLLKEKYEKDEI